MDKKYTAAPCPKCSQEATAITIGVSTAIQCAACKMIFDGDRVVPFVSHIKGGNVYAEMLAQLDAVGVINCADYLWFKDAIWTMHVNGDREAFEMQAACVAAIDNMRAILAASERAHAKAPAEVTNG